MTAWSKEEDFKLCNLINQHGEGNWKKISEYFTNRTHHAVAKRWKRIDPSIASGKWQSEEDVRLIDWMATIAKNSIDTFKPEGKARRRYDVVKRIFYYKEVLCQQICGIAGRKMEVEVCKARKRTIKNEFKEESKDDISTIVKQDIENGIQKCKAEKNQPDVYDNDEDKKIDDKNNEIYKMFLKK